MLQRDSVLTVLVIDEIGKMELFSKNFVEAARSAFYYKNVVVLATIPVAHNRSHWLVEELRRREDCRLFEVSEDCVECAYYTLIHALNVHVYINT